MSTSDVINLVYDELGQGNTEAVLILHGFFASSRNWRKIAEKFAEIYHVYVPDMRNHGASPHHAVMDYPAMMQDVLHFMDAHALASVNLIGHSMGGKIAMWLTLKHPERVKKLVVVDIAPKRYSHNFDKTINALVNLPLAELKNRKQAEVLLAEAIPQLEFRQFLLQNLVLAEGKYGWRIDLSIFQSSGQYIAGFPDCRNLPTSTVPTLFVAGSESHYLAENDTLELFKSGEFRLISGAGHWLHVQKAEVFIEVVEKFLQSRR